MLLILIFILGLGLIAGITLLVIGITKLCHKSNQNETQKSNTAGILFTVFGGLLTFVFLILTVTIFLLGRIGM